MTALCFPVQELDTPQEQFESEPSAILAEIHAVVKKLGDSDRCPGVGSRDATLYFGIERGSVT